jgi:plastocyanin
MKTAQIALVALACITMGIPVVGAWDAPVAADASWPPVAIIPPVPESPADDPFPVIIASCMANAASAPCTFLSPVHFAKTGQRVDWFLQTGSHSVTAGLVGQLPIPSGDTEPTETTVQNGVNNVQGNSALATLWTTLPGLREATNPHLNLFDSGVLPQGTTLSYTFDEPGVYLYYCRPHSTLGMHGVVIVQQADA